MSACVGYDDVARDVIEGWLKQFPLALFGPGTRAAALLQIARVAEELAEREEAKIPDLFE